MWFHFVEDKQVSAALDVVCECLMAPRYFMLSHTAFKRAIVVERNYIGFFRQRLLTLFELRLLPLKGHPYLAQWVPRVNRTHNKCILEVRAVKMACPTYAYSKSYVFHTADERILQLNAHVSACHGVVLNRGTHYMCERDAHYDERAPA